MPQYDWQYTDTLTRSTPRPTTGQAPVQGIRHEEATIRQADTAHSSRRSGAVHREQTTPRQQAQSVTHRTAQPHSIGDSQSSGRPANSTGMRTNHRLSQNIDSPAEGQQTDSATATACVQPVDWSTAYPYPVYGTADSLSTLPGTRPAAYRNVSAESIFGAQSIAVPPRFSIATTPRSLTDNPVFQSFVLLLAATYAILLYRNLGDIRQLLGHISRDAATGNRLTEEPGTSGFLRFLNITTTIGMLFMGVMMVKYADTLLPQSLFQQLPQGAELGLSLVATGICTVVMLYQRLVVRLAGAVTLSQPLISQLLLLKRTCFSLAVIVASPVLLLFALCPRGTGEALLYVIAAELILTALLYLGESLSLFISKKVSILHWFLYLCAVEIFPVSLLLLLTAR